MLVSSAMNNSVKIAVPCTQKVNGIVIVSAGTYRGVYDSYFL